MNRIIYRRYAVAILFIAAVSAAVLPVTANSRRSKQKAEKKEQKKKASVLPPVAVVNNPSPEYRSGEVSVAVRGNENPIIRLGLAQNGVTLVEFPAADRFFAINPGSSDLVTIEDSPTKETDHFFVIRAGLGFLLAVEGSKLSAPATSIIVQMSSGMVVTFLLYPVKDIERNAHRCVVTYNREAIVKARQAAGLATNLDRREQTATVKPSSLALRFTPLIETLPLPPPPVIVPPAVNEEKPKKDDVSLKPFPPDLKFPGNDERWSKRLHGLKIAVQTRILSANHRQALIAVRNTLSKPVQIVPGFPELYVDTLDDKGRVLQTERIKRRKITSQRPSNTVRTFLPSAQCYPCD
ncbi:MAG: hypothetical protein ACREEM_26060 [Blastocatellia bacterium]